MGHIFLRMRAHVINIQIQLLSVVISLVIYSVMFSQCVILFQEKTTTRCLAQFQSTTTNPITYKDCSIFSKKDNSCCYYKYQKQTNCVWLGKSDVGTMRYKDLLVICQGRYSKINIFAIVLLILMSIV